MENEKKVYSTPEAEKIEYDFSEQVVAASGGYRTNDCRSDAVWDASYKYGRCWPLYTH